MNEILRILEEDARKTPQQIATMTGIPLSKVKETIKQAERDRTILKYKAMVNWDKLGDEQVTALVDVRLEPQRDVGFGAIAERIPVDHRLVSENGAVALRLLNRLLYFGEGDAGHGGNLLGSFASILFQDP